MKLPALLGHASELLRIISKSHQPSDKIVSEYFRSKKYIGGTERRFLSELVYTTLRNISLAEYCLKSSYSKISDVLLGLNIEKEFFLVSIITYLHENFEELKVIFFPSEILRNLNNYKNEEFNQQIHFSISEKFNIELDLTMKFFDEIKLSFNELNSKISKIKVKRENLINEEITTIRNRFSMPSWIVERWLNNQFFKFSIEEICGISESLLYPAALTIRVNLSLITRDEIIIFLRKNDIDCQPCELSPSGIKINKRIQFNTLEIFKKGFIEIQDEGSQLISYALNPDDNELILDACAGAGGKTIHIADIKKNSGNIVASDVDYRKLRELLKRAKRAGFNSIATQNLSNIIKDSGRFQKDIKVKDFDRVLIDAPCSGMGTVRRMPMQKWRLTPELLKKHSDKQLLLLEYYSKFVKAGGVLLYSTCSLMEEENEAVVNKFLLQNNNFKPYPLKYSFDKYNINIPGLSDNDFMLRLSPHIHGCDGFFMAKMIRVE